MDPEKAEAKAMPFRRLGFAFRVLVPIVKVLIPIRSNEICSLSVD